VAATENIGNVCQSITAECVENSIMPKLDTLVTDDSHFVRSALARVIATIPRSVSLKLVFFLLDELVALPKNRANNYFDLSQSYSKMILPVCD
jgi:hypothetical protein